MGSILVCQQCGNIATQFARFCKECGNPLSCDETAVIFEAVEFNLFSSWEKDYCNGGDNSHHILQCAGAYESFFCSACGREIKPFEKELK
jgi:hypothetical protein